MSNNEREDSVELLHNVLIVGSGGREHAILKALLRSERALCTFAYPGNPGMENDGCMLVEDKINTWEDLANWASNNEINLTIVGPEVPLVEGITDIFKEKGLAVFGPDAFAAQIEGSKAFAKDLMEKNNIPTAAYKKVESKEAAQKYLDETGAPIVVKVSGLAAGKGAIVCDTREEADTALQEIFDKKAFGDAGSIVVLEEKLVGEEASVFVLTDGNTYKILPVSQDHKPIGEGDTGPNTGGMGAFAPAAVVDTDTLKTVEETIIVPTLEAMKKLGHPYRGLLYVGIILTTEGPKVIEYNCRFGDPETQAVLPLITCDWYEVFKACASGGLDTVDWTVREGACVTVVCASAGYPGAYEKGKEIAGIDDAEFHNPDVDVYHAGTKRAGNDTFVTNGGRVLAVSAYKDNLVDAIAEAYVGVSKIDFEGKTFRKDIAAKGLKRL